MLGFFAVNFCHEQLIAPFFADFFPQGDGQGGDGGDGGQGGDHGQDEVDHLALLQLPHEDSLSPHDGPPSTTSFRNDKTPPGPAVLVEQSTSSRDEKLRALFREKAALESDIGDLKGEEKAAKQRVEDDPEKKPEKKHASSEVGGGPQSERKRTAKAGGAKSSPPREETSDKEGVPAPSVPPSTHSRRSADKPAGLKPAEKPSEPKPAGKSGSSSSPGKKASKSFFGTLESDADPPLKDVEGVFGFGGSHAKTSASSSTHSHEEPNHESSKPKGTKPEKAEVKVPGYVYCGEIAAVIILSLIFESEEDKLRDFLEEEEKEVFWLKGGTGETVAQRVVLQHTSSHV